jgi:hypothetical protein
MAYVVEDEIPNLRGNMNWKPIDTAPRDGSILLACCSNIGPTCYPIAVQWHKGAWRNEINEKRDPEWWMPLPEPPMGGYV